MTATNGAVIDRQELADRIQRFVLSAKSSVLVLHGPPASGKTALLKDSVLDDLRAAVGPDGREVWYGECSAGLPRTLEGPNGSVPFGDVVQRNAIIFLDNTETLFGLPREEQSRTLEELFGYAVKRDRRAPFVLVTDDRQLTSVYALCTYDPQIVDAMFDMGPVDITEGLQQLKASRGDDTPVYDPDVLALLTEDVAALEAAGWDVTFDLIAVLDRSFCAAPALASDPARYRAVGGLRGILQTYLEDRLNQLPEGDEEIARAILEHRVEAGADDLTATAEELLPRLGITSDQLSAVLARLVDVGLLQNAVERNVQLMPQQLGAILEEDIKERRVDNDRTRRILDEGLRSWSLLGTPLPRVRFEEVHRERRSLKLSAEQTRFMLQNSLRYEERELEGASAYWLRRMPHEREGMDVLLASLFSDARRVRLRAAALLRGFNDPEVRERLRVVSLTDADAEVRAQAINSLEPMQSGELMQQLIDEVTAQKSTFRIEAVEVLRVFKDSRVTTVLQNIAVGKDTPTPLRHRAIAVLGSSNTPEAVDALIDVALHDSEPEDRAAAARALGATASETLQRRILQKLHTPGGQIVPALICTTSALILFVAGFVTARPRGVIGPVISFGAAVLLALLLRKWRPATGLLNRSILVALSVLSALFAFFWVHGLVYAVTGRWRRGLGLFALEVVAVGLMVVSSFVIMPGLLTWVPFLLLGGFTLFAWTYTRGVYRVLLDTLLFGDRVALEKRKNLIYLRLLSNDVAARTMLADLQSANQQEIREARRLIKRLGTNISPAVLIDALKSNHVPTRRLAARALRRNKTEEIVRALVDLWPTGGAELQRRITSVLCRAPNERAVEALDKLRPHAGPIQKARFHFATWLHRVRVWPRSALVTAAVILPLLIVGVYHGVMVLTNPAWGQILTVGVDLDRAGVIGPSSEKKMIEAALVMAEHYPRESTDVLLELFRKRQHAHEPPVHAAVARAMVMIQNGLSDADPRKQQIRRELIAQSDSFYRQMASDTSSVKVLTDMANAEDRQVADTAVHLLRRFLLTRPDTGVVNPVTQQLVIAGLGSIRPERAIAVLNEIHDSTQFVLGDQIRRQLKLTAQRAFLGVLERDVAVGMLPDSARMSAANALRVRADSVQKAIQVALPNDRIAVEMKEWLDRSSCDFNNDGVCSDLDEALSAIKTDPNAEYGYRLILDYYTAASQQKQGVPAAVTYGEARNTFAELEQRYPNSVWPGKLLSTVYHEYLFENPQAFKQAFDENVAIRKLGAYQELGAADRQRLDADFVEIALTAQQYDTLERTAREVMRESDTQTNQFNMRLFLYAASVMQHNSAEAQRRLNELERAVESLPPEFYNNWSYPGTKDFFKHGGLSVDMEQALIDLCREGSWYSREKGREVIARNRQALQRLKKP